MPAVQGCLRATAGQAWPSLARSLLLLVVGVAAAGRLQADSWPCIEPPERSAAADRHSAIWSYQMSSLSLRSAAPSVAAPFVCLIITSSQAMADMEEMEMAGGSNLPPIVVTAQHLYEGRSHIQTQTGASTYTVDSAAIAATPGGDNTLLNQVIMQAPEVAQDSFGQFHVRGEHNGLQYRLNGIILPEGISVFGQSLDPRLISSMSVVTGALPAEYGLRTAGIIDITTKNGLQAPGGPVSLYAGSHGPLPPSFPYPAQHASFHPLAP